MWMSNSLLPRWASRKHPLTGGSNCGNCSAVVGLYAIEKGWVVPDGDSTRIVTRNTNTGQIIIQRVSTPAGACRSSLTPKCPASCFPVTGWASVSRIRPARPPGVCFPPARQLTQSLRRNPLDGFHGGRGRTRGHGAG